jgi:hypothetical protein
VTADREAHGHGRIEVGPRDVPEGRDHDHDHQPEAECDAEVAELVRPGVHHDRAAAGEDERERAHELGDEALAQTGHQAVAAGPTTVASRDSASARSA